MFRSPCRMFWVYTNQFDFASLNMWFFCNIDIAHTPKKLFIATNVKLRDKNTTELIGHRIFGRRKDTQKPYYLTTALPVYRTYISLKRKITRNIDRLINWFNHMSTVPQYYDTWLRILNCFLSTFVKSIVYYF